MKRLWIALVLGLVCRSFATIHVVTVSGLSFTPANLTVFHGDTVRWNKTDADFHNIAESSATPVFRSGDPVSTPYVYDFVFNAPLIGVYNYACEVHEALGMTGTITVRGLKTVNVQGLSFSPAAVTIQQGDTVRWIKPAGGIHNVRESGGTPDTVFYSGAPTSAAFTYDKIFNAPLAGTYNYRCDVHFGVGMTGTVTVLIPPPPPCLDPTNLTILPEGTGVRFHWQAPSAGHYDVYSTTDPTLITPPPGAGWSLAVGADVAVAGQATAFYEPVDPNLIFVVVQDCTP